MHRVIKVCFLSSVLLISFNSFAGPVSAAICTINSDSKTCNEKNIGPAVGKHLGAAVVVKKKKSE